MCYVNNTSVGAVTGLLDNCVMNFFLHLVASASNGVIVAAEAILSHTLWHRRHGASNAEIDYVSDAFNMLHLDRPVVMFPWHIDTGAGHWILLILDHRTRTITVADPLGHNSADYFIVNRVRPAIRNWLARERVRYPDHAVWAGLPVGAQYTITAAEGIPTQTDGTSCGAFALAYAYFFLFHGRLPTHADFNGAHAPALRAMILDAITNGRLRTPLPAAAVAGAALGGGAGGTAVTGARGGTSPALALPAMPNFAVDFDGIARGLRWGRSREMEKKMRRKNRILQLINDNPRVDGEISIDEHGNIVIREWTAADVAKNQADLRKFHLSRK